MKTQLPTGLLVLSIFAILSCSKNDSAYFSKSETVKPRLESAIYPLLSQSNEVVPSHQTVFGAGEAITVFVPYRAVGDKVYRATLRLKDASTGETLREIPMTASTDLSVMNVVVPEEIQGAPFQFSTVSIDQELAGKSINLSSELMGGRFQSKDEWQRAFIVQ